MNRETYIEINVKNLVNNVKNIISHYKYKYYIGVVKGNAYGHGFDIVNDLIANGINFLAVSTLDEALTVRKINNEIPILCLQPIHYDLLHECVKNNISICLHSREYYENIEKMKFKEPLKIHIKIDSGMNRLGINNKKDLNEVYEGIQKNDNLYLEGIFTHFSTTGFMDVRWKSQVQNFKEITSDIDLTKIPVVHIDKSTTMLMHEKLDFCNAVRLGIIMYGYNHVPRYGNSFKDKLRKLKRTIYCKLNKIDKTNEYRELNLKTAFTMYSRVIEVKKIKKGDFVGYGLRYQAENDEIIAVVECGYNDGISRRSSGRYVAINDKLFPIVGDVSMGMIMVRVDETVKMWDQVVIMGGLVPVNYVARHLNTTVYEAMCMLDSSIPRRYIR